MAITRNVLSLFTILLFPIIGAFGQLSLKPIGSVTTGIFDGAAAEIAAYDPGTQRIFVTNAAENRVDVIDIDDPAHPIMVTPLDTEGLSPNSVAVTTGKVAVAVESSPKTDPGYVMLFTPTGTKLAQYAVGALPDMLTFTPDGKYILVANEGEPDTEYLNDPEGSVSIITVATGEVRTAGFGGFSADELDPTIRLFGLNASIAQDLEPEYIAVAPDSKTAWVTLQEANALGVLDIESGKFVEIVPAGLKDHSLPGNGIDASDRDDGINIRNWPVLGMRMPDAIASFQAAGKTYYVTANEGDAREYDGLEEETRISSLTLDPTAFPDADTLQANANLGRLNVTEVNGDTDGDGDYDELWSFGGRGITIYSSDGAIVWDSGDQFEKITAAAYPENFNASNDDNSLDNRSDNKGPEPEGLTTGSLGGRQYVFVTLERIGGVMVFDVTDPIHPFFVTYANNRNFGADPESAEALDLGPESAVMISAGESPNGKPLLVVPNEVSGSTTIFQIGALTDVTDKVTVDVSQAVQRRQSETSFGFVIVRNQSGEVIPGPIHVVFRNLPEGVEILNPSFVNGEGMGFTLPAPFDTDLQSHATRIAPGIEFAVPRGTRLQFDARVYAGSIE